MRKIFWIFSFVFIFSLGFHDAEGAVRTIEKQEGDKIFGTLAEEVNGMERKIGLCSASSNERLQFYRYYDALVSSVNQAFSVIQVGYYNDYNADDTVLLPLLQEVVRNMEQLRRGLYASRGITQSELRDFDGSFQQIDNQQYRLKQLMGVNSQWGGIDNSGGGVVLPGGNGQNQSGSGQYQPAPILPMQPNQFPIIQSNDFNELLRALKVESFSSNRKRLLESAARHAYFNVDQVLAVLDVLDFDSDRISASLELYPRVVDASRWFLVYEKFSFSRSKEKVRAETSKMQPAGY